MKDYRLNAGPRRPTRALPVTIVATALLMVTPATALASGSASRGHHSVYSAAHAQYGGKPVLPPTKPVVASKGAVKATKGVAPKISAGTAPKLTTGKRVSTLPFTGLSLLKIAILGIALVAGGIVLRIRGARAGR